MERAPKIAIAGNQWITEYLLKRMVSGGYAPSLIINLGEEKAKNISGYVDLRPLASEYKIEIYRPALYSLKSEADRKALSCMGVDVLLVFGWQRLIPEWLIECCRLGVYGVHGGPEKPPRARGRAVFNWALILGYTRFYLYMFKITPAVDAGGIVELTEFDIMPQDDLVSLYHKNCVVSARMFMKHMPAILSATVRLVGNPEEGATFMPKRSPENSGICWDMSAERITNLIRAMVPPYPTTFTYLDRMRVEILRGHTFDHRIPYFGAPGEILEVFTNGDFIVMTGDHPLYVRQSVCEDRYQIVPGRVFQLRSGEQLADPHV